ncbi:MAG: class I SAM-dependent methyltransferase [Alphaproteobacteria bacterium]|nr:class I SAM-dependent methyltransferase [Alphaproteobacteria bacterium]MBU0796690.1 class I SAM-dependent methyltransferase [Alphaproteobacteria bacterium]MBU0888239.1 class I SAM-dependent methyltransferase [Alphaproteobacteria bacterium]MBU1811440.1 class I SAM-dependent methyltransferase [Alphaproteobacteria bacterium]
MAQRRPPTSHEERLAALYRPRLQEYGAGPDAQGWPSSFEQKVRFAALAGIGIGPTDSVLDVGCGLGDFVDHLAEQDFQGSYTGIDLLPEMIEGARAREHPPTIGTRFEVADLAQDPQRWQADIVIASGIFVVMTEAEAHQTIATLFQACRRAVAFTSLSRWDPTENIEGYLRLDPAETLNYCRTLTPRVLLRHEYFLTDFTMYLFRD